MNNIIMDNANFEDVNDVEEIIVEDIEALEEIICPGNGCTGPYSQCC